MNTKIKANVSDIGLLLVSVLLAVFGVIHLGKSLHGLVISLQSNSWLQTPAVITKARVEEYSGRGALNYAPLVHYTYRVGNSDYFGDRVWVVFYGDDKQWATKIVSHYPIGSTVLAFYDSDNPSSSVLIRGANTFAYTSVAMAALAILIGSLMGWYFVRKIL